MHTVNNYINEFIDKREKYSKDTYRGLFHYSPRVGWINDPNGFCSKDNKLHLFSQYHPYSSEWGPMHWYHATSQDGFDWKFEGIALAPNEEYDHEGCFSGTSLVEGDVHRIYYTGVADGKQQQCLAVFDEENFIKHENNPIVPESMIPEQFDCKNVRDPKVFIHDGLYYMLLGTNRDKGGTIICFKSQDGISFEYAGEVLHSEENEGGVYECPDFVAVDGKTFLIFSPQFKAPEGEQFHNIFSSVYCEIELGDVFKVGPLVELDFGFDFYAPQTTIHNGQPILMAWMSMWDTKYPLENQGWKNQMTIPRKLMVKDGALCQYVDQQQIDSINLKVDKDSVYGVYQFETVNEFKLELENEYSFIYDGTKMVVSRDKDKYKNVSKNEDSSTRTITDTITKLIICIDKSSVEIFINDSYSVTVCVYSDLTKLKCMLNGQELNLMENKNE